MEQTNTSSTIEKNGVNGTAKAQRSGGIKRHCAKWWWLHLLIFIAIVLIVVLCV
jgi:hypothetical protein